MAGEGIDTTRLQALSRAWWQSAALFAAIELGVFTAISRGADTVAALAARLRIPPRQAERLLTALAAMTLLKRDGERFANAPDVERFLVEDSSRYAGPWMLFGKPRWEAWGSLAERLRSADERRLGEYESFTVDDARRYHRATASIGRGAARRFVREVDLSHRRLLLDLGGGSGAYSIAAAERFAGLRAIVLELPPVVPVAREFIAEAGAEKRVSAETCDFTRDPLPAGADVALMASNLPQYAPEIVAAVIAKVFDALLPGGEFHLVGEALDDDRAGPLDPALWGLNEAILGSTGLAHSVADCRRWFAAAGFVGVTASPFVPGVLTRVSGRKP
jgi:hypothetical protein